MGGDADACLGEELPPNVPAAGTEGKEEGRRTVSFVLAAPEGVGTKPTILTLHEQPHGWWQVEERSPDGRRTLWPTLHQSVAQVREILFARANLGKRTRGRKTVR